MKFIGKNISYQDNKDGVFSVVIAAAVERYKEGLLLTWLLIWTTCGVYFISELFWGNHPRELKLYMLVLLSFWAFYEWKVASVLFWRLWGYESIRFVDNKLITRNVVKGLGKSKTYLVENIEEFKVPNRNAKSFVEAMQNSFWVKGNNAVFFDHMGKTIAFGKQLSIKDADQLCRILNRELGRRLKKL